MEYAYLIPSSVQSGENSLTTAKIFFQRLSELTDSFLTEDTNWDGILLTGSLVCAMMQTDFDPELYLDSDIDLFVYHPTARYDIIVKLVAGHKVTANHAGLYNIRLPNKRIIQIIQTGYNDPNLIINHYDLTNCQAGYTDYGFIFTDEYLKSVRDRVAVLNKNNIRIDRLIKNYQRGYATAITYSDTKIRCPKYAQWPTINLSLADIVKNPLLLANYPPTKWTNYYDYYKRSVFQRECFMSQIGSSDLYMVDNIFHTQRIHNDWVFDDNSG